MDFHPCCSASKAMRALSKPGAIATAILDFTWTEKLTAVLMLAISQFC